MRSFSAVFAEATLDSSLAAAACGMVACGGRCVRVERSRPMTPAGLVGGAMSPRSTT